MKAPNSLATIMIITAALAALFGTASAARQDPAQRAIVAQSRALMAAIETGDAAAVANLFTADAGMSVAPTGGVIRGRANIEGFWRVVFGSGLAKLDLVSADLQGDGNLRVETGSYRALGADGRELGRGQYLLSWIKEGGEWKISNDFAVPDTVPVAAATPAGAGLPPDYSTRFRVMGGTSHDDRQGLTTVYANALAAAAAGGEASIYPNGAVVLMEFAAPQRDGEDQLLRDAQGQPLKGAIAHIDVMRRGGRTSGVPDASRAGEWEFSSYRPDGTTLVAPANAAHCAACHLKAGADKDFVFRLRTWEAASPN